MSVRDQCHFQGLYRALKNSSCGTHRYLLAFIKAVLFAEMMIGLLI